MNDTCVILDGGFGTMLQDSGLAPGKDPLEWNIENPGAVEEVHRAYVDAGAGIIAANTFGANSLKYRGPHDLEELIRSGISIARRASGGRCKVAVDIGPTGRMLKPAGDIPFDEVREVFARQVRCAVDCGADIVLVETMGDLKELKAAVIAAKENSSLPVYATVALQGDGKTLTGSGIECVAALMESLGVDAYGLNCGVGPAQMLPAVEYLGRVSRKPVIVKPNAGIPSLVDGKTVFSVGEEEFAVETARLVRAGASVVGGCCGTTPGHIRFLRRYLEENGISPGGKTPDGEGASVVSSATAAVTLRPGDGIIIGERINPTGKRLLKEAYAKGDMAYVLREAVAQVNAGAKILDVNCGVPGIDETSTLVNVLEALDGVVSCPIQVDTSDPAALAAALPLVNGKALVNSVNGKRESMDAVFPLVKKYGGVMVALCLDENGIPPTAEGRVEIARRILKEGEKYGFTKADFVFDALTLAVSADPEAAKVTLKTVQMLSSELGVNTVLGVSNVSFALPGRVKLNNAMYSLARRAGLSAAIANPSAIADDADEAAVDVLMGRDPNCERWIALNGSAPPPAPPRQTALPSLKEAVLAGLKLDARAAAERELASGVDALGLVNGSIVPALEETGALFEKGKVFLPQLLMAADAAGAAFEEVRKALSATGCVTRRGRPIVLATVKGDIHDIGKNIVRSLLDNYGFEVIDLGRDVDPARIADAAEKSQAMLVGLSALMTTTVKAMEETVRLLRERGLAVPVCVGGAVVTEEYAASIGADYYAADAMRTVRIAENLI